MLEPLLTHPVRAILIGQLVLLVFFAFSGMPRDVAEIRTLYRAARQMTATNELYAGFSEASRNLSAERGRTSLVLQGPGTVSDRDREFIAARRTAAEKSLGSALALGRPGNPLRAGQVEHSLAAVRLLRPRVDRDLALPRAARDPELLKAWYRATTELSGRVVSFLVALGDIVGDPEGGYLHILDARLLSLQLRNAMGTDSALLAAQIASGEPMPAPVLSSISALKGEDNFVWRALERKAGLVRSPAVTAAVGTARQSILISFRPLQQGVLQAAINGESSALTAKTYAVAAASAFDSMDRLMATLAEAARGHAAKLQRAAQRKALLLGAQGILLLMLLGGAIAVINRRVIHPLERFSRDLERLRRGELDTAHKPSGPPDEFGSLAAGLEEFRQTLLSRREAEAARRENEARFRVLFDSSSDAMLIFDGSSFLDCNPSALTLFRVKDKDKEQFLRQHPVDLSAPLQEGGAASRPAAEERIARAFDLGVDLFEWVCRRCDGELFEGEVLLSRFELNGERLLQATVREISKRKQEQAELALYRLRLEEMVSRRTAELARSEMRVRTILETVADGIITIDSAGTVLSFNPAATRIFGFSADEVVGQNVAALMPGPDGGSHDGHLDGHLATGETLIGYGRELTALRKDGTSFPLELSVSQMNLDGARVFTGVMRDLSERRHAEEQLRQSEERYAMAERTGNIGSWDLDLDSGQLFISAQLSRICGLPGSTRTVSVESWMESVCLVDLPLFCRALDASVDSGHPFEAEYRVALPDGTPRWLFSHGELVASADRASGRLIGISQDVTERVKARDLLRQAMEHAEAASRAKSEFLANMSHEIRTPLNAIIGFSDLLLAGELSDNQREFALKTEESGRRLLGIINAILDFSNMEAGRMKLEPTEFSLEQSLEQLVAEFRERAREKGLELVISLPPEVPQRLVGDATRLVQVLANLVSNGVKFTQSGEVELEVELEESAASPSRLRFRVRDTGIGIAQEQQALLFTPFAQADGSTTRRFGGTGLGLIICRRLVALMGGELGVQSARGEGSCFSFSVPFGRAPAREPVGIPEQLRALRVLIADDSRASAQAQGRSCAALSLSAQTVDSGAAALAALGERGSDPFRLLLLDCDLPGSDALETVRSVREDAGGGGGTQGGAGEYLGVGKGAGGPSRGSRRLSGQAVHPLPAFGDPDRALRPGRRGGGRRRLPGKDGPVGAAPALGRGRRVQPAARPAFSGARRRQGLRRGGWGGGGAPGA